MEILLLYTGVLLIMGIIFCIDPHKSPDKSSSLATNTTGNLTTVTFITTIPGPGPVTITAPGPTVTTTITASPTSLSSSSSSPELATSEHNIGTVLKAYFATFPDLLLQLLIGMSIAIAMSIFVAMVFGIGLWMWSTVSERRERWQALRGEEVAEMRDVEREGEMRGVTDGDALLEKEEEGGMDVEKVEERDAEKERERMVDIEARESIDRDEDRHTLLEKEEEGSVDTDEDEEENEQVFYDTDVSF